MSVRNTARLLVSTFASVVCNSNCGLPLMPRCQRDLDRLKFPADAELLDQLAEQAKPEAEAQPQKPGMIPAEQVGNIVEQQVILREHQARWQQAMQDPDFAEFASSVPVSDVEWAPEIGATVAAQHDSPALVAFLCARTDLAQQLAQMPIPRALAEVSRLSAWLHSQLQPQNAPAPVARVSNAPQPINPVRGSGTKSSVPLDQADYQTFKRVREAQVKGRYR
jgi:hypothetical protein